MPLVSLAAPAPRTTADKDKEPTVLSRHKGLVPLLLSPEVEKGIVPRQCPPTARQRSRTPAARVVNPLSGEQPTSSASLLVRSRALPEVITLKYPQGIRECATRGREERGKRRTDSPASKDASAAAAARARPLRGPRERVESRIKPETAPGLELGG